MVVSLNYPWREEGQLYLIDLDGNIKKRLTWNRHENSVGSFEKDRDRLVYSEWGGKSGGSKINILDLKTLKIRNVLNSGHLDIDPYFSPEGTKIVFIRPGRQRNEHMGFGKIWSYWDVYLCNLQDTSVRRLTQGDYYAAYGPKFFSKDSILYSLINTHGKNKFEGISKIELTSLATESTFPLNADAFILSADQTQILYTKQDQRSKSYYFSKLILRDLATEEEHLIFSTEKGHYLDGFSLSPDKNKVAIILKSGEARADYSSELVLIDLVTGKKRSIQIKEGKKVLEDKNKFSFSKIVSNFWL